MQPQRKKKRTLETVTNKTNKETHSQELKNRIKKKKRFLNKRKKKIREKMYRSQNLKDLGLTSKQEFYNTVGFHYALTNAAIARNMFGTCCKNDSCVWL